MSPSYDKDFVGIRSRVEQIENWLNRGDVRSVGIWGLGGIGKTTLAQAVSMEISCQFDHSYFIGNIRERAEEGGLSSLRNSSLSKLLEDENARIGGTFTNDRLGPLKLLIIFDDVTEVHQIESLIGDLDRFASGSRVIVTSRDKQVLQRLDCMYEVKELPFNYALKLFCRHAFRQNYPYGDYEKLSYRLVKMVGGVPLPLAVLGNCLSGKEIKVWMSALEKLENITDKEIHDVLKLTYNGLDYFEQKMFLDIAYFFTGLDVNLVIRIMHDRGFFADIGMRTLIDKSLITISDNKVTMHYLLQAMAKKIGLQEGYRKGITCWVKGEPLGSGSFGSVYEGISDEGFSFAVKEVSLLDQSSKGKQSISQLEQEIALLSQFEHENIVQYIGTDKDESKLYIFLELATKGSLRNLYQRDRLTDSKVSAYTRQILHGLKYLHDRNVVHRDIKCANILVFGRERVKLADFGLAKATKLNDVKSFQGTPFWMAPEVVNNKNEGYGIQADIWSLGCTVLEMLTRQFPYSPLEPHQALFQIGRGVLPPIPDHLSKDARDARDARDFILKCLQTNPSDRPTAAQLLDHSFVKKPLPTFSGSP